MARKKKDEAVVEPVVEAKPKTARKRTTKKKEVVNEIPPVVETPKIATTPIVETTIPDDAEPMSLDEFYDAVEQSQIPNQIHSSNPTTSTLSNAISYYDRATHMLSRIDIGRDYPLTGYTPLFSYLSTEPNKVKFGEILLSSFGKYIKHKKYATKYSPIINVHIQYLDNTTPVGIVNLLNTVVGTIIDWCDARYFPVKDVNAFSKYMTEEIENPTRTHKHKCVLLKTRPFVLPDGNMTTSGIPVIWNFTGSYIDPGSKATTFLYEVDQAYTTDPSRPGLKLSDTVVLNKYTITMSEIIELINAPDSMTLFIFQADELYTFVKKEVNNLFDQIQLDIVEELQ